MAKPKILYDNRFADATPAASTTATGTAVANLADFRPYTWWAPTALPATITVDCGSAKSADLLAIFGHNLFAGACTVEVRGSTDNFAASDVLVASNTPTSDALPVVVPFTSVAYRYWRLKITGTTAPALAIALIGAALELPTYLEQGFDPIGRKVDGRRARNNNGQPLGQLVDFESWSDSINLRAVSWSWVRATWLPAWQAHLRSAPFVFAWDATTYPAESRLVTADDQFSTPHKAGALADLSVKLSGVA